MGWRDREYARGESTSARVWPPRTGSLLRGRSAVSVLIAVNVAVFAVCTLTIQGRVLGGRDILSSPVFHALAMHAGNVLHGEVWRIITAQYLHWDFWHIFMNMLGLHFLGRALERDWGPRRFLVIYTIAGTLGMIALTALTRIGWLPAAPAAGASGCVLGLLGAAAVLYPSAVIYIQFFLPVKIRTAALLFGAWYAFNLYQRGSNAGGDACHLAGMLFGAWWAYRGETWWEQVGGRWRQRRGQARRVRVRRFTPDFERRVEDAATIDRILKKVYEGGLHSLSEAEKNALREATERQKAAESGRFDTL